jgi:hypothetical protein
MKFQKNNGSYYNAHAKNRIFYFKKGKFEFDRSN